MNPIKYQDMNELRATFNLGSAYVCEEYTYSHVQLCYVHVFFYEMYICDPPSFRMLCYAIDFINSLLLA